MQKELEQSMSLCYNCHIMERALLEIEILEKLQTLRDAELDIRLSTCPNLLKFKNLKKMQKNLYDELASHRRVAVYE